MKAGQIVGVCSAKNDSIVRQHGATEVMDYNKVNTYIYAFYAYFIISMTYPLTLKTTKTSLTWCTMPALTAVPGRTTRTR